jgi:hypothetical protein
MRNQQRVIHASHGPPDNEIPAVLAPGVAWRGDGAVLAVPSLLVYTTGIELLVMYRTKATGRPSLAEARAAAPLSGLTVNDRPVGALGGGYDDHGFTYRAWVPLEGLDSVTFALDWPGIEPARRHVTGLREAASRVIVI